MPDLISPIFGGVSFTFQMQSNTSDQTILDLDNISNYFIVLYIGNIANNMRVKTLYSNTLAYNKIWSATNDQSDFDPDTRAILLNMPPNGLTRHIVLQSVVAEGSVKDITVSYRRWTY